jgi:hypothetical protein
METTYDINETAADEGKKNTTSIYSSPATTLIFNR